MSMRCFLVLIHGRLTKVDSGSDDREGLDGVNTDPSHPIDRRRTWSGVNHQMFPVEAIVAALVKCAI